jgi:tol-pal system protein YbgF
MKKKLIILVFSLLSSGCALRSDVVYLNDRIDTLDNKVTLQKVASDDATGEIRKNYAKLSNDYDSISERIRQLRGYYDENSHKIEKSYSSSDKLKSDIDKLGGLITKLNDSITDLSKRISRLENYTGIDESVPAAKNPGTTPVAPGSDPSAVVAPDVKIYNDAKAAMDNGDTKTARDGFTKLIKDYPNSKIVDNAQFWVGETYYKEKWYPKAILEYQKVIENYPKGNKVSSAYLKQALSFSEMGETGNAKLILRQLIKKFPNSSDASIAKKKLEKLK